MKRILCLVLALLTAFYTVSAEEELKTDASEEVSEETVPELEIDRFRKQTMGSVEQIMASGSYKITTVDPESITLPDSIPKELTDKLRSTLDKAPYSCSMYYIDLETGFEISYNGDRFYRGASTVKAPYLMALFNKIEKGKLSFDDEYTYNVDRTGTVQISKDYKKGAKLSVRTLIEYLIYYSDNVAFTMLLNNACSVSEFRSYCKSAYGAEFYKGGTNWLNSYGVAKAFEDIYRKAKAGNEIYVWYVELLKMANENKFVKGGLPEGSDYEVAHKYGMDINASNDAAIVYYGERPYVLIVLTDYIGYNTQGFINRVSESVFNIHEYIVKNG